MGVWGASIFSDDDAADLREEYRTMIGDGLSGPEATDRLLNRWRPSFEKDPDLAATFWLALAVTQWKCGRLEERVKNEAIRAIDDGSALRRWRGNPLEAKRSSVLNAAKRQLESPQPLARRIGKRFRSTCDWQPGELIAYRLRSGFFIVFQVIEHHTDQGGVAPVCEIFDWQGHEPPHPALLEAVPMRAETQPTKVPRYRIMIVQASKRGFPKDRLIQLNAKLPIQHPPKPRNVANPTLVCLWRDLDQQLERHYGFR